MGPCRQRCHLPAPLAPHGWTEKQKYEAYMEWELEKKNILEKLGSSTVTHFALMFNYKDREDYGLKRDDGDCRFHSSFCDSKRHFGTIAQKYMQVPLDLAEPGKPIFPKNHWHWLYHCSYCCFSEWISIHWCNDGKWKNVYAMAIWEQVWRCNAGQWICVSRWGDGK